MRPRRIAMVSEHANPLARPGSPECGGQNVHVAGLAAALARRGDEVTVYTRRDDPAAARTAFTEAGYVVRLVDAGPARPVARDDLLPHMGAFARGLAAAWRQDRPDVVHAHFWMSGVACLEAGRALGLPVVQTFHALGAVKRRVQGSADTSPRARVGLEARLARSVDWVVATAADEARELAAMGADPSRVSVVPCGFQPERFFPSAPPGSSARPGRLVAVGRLVARKGIADLLGTLARLAPPAHLLVAGGPPAAELDASAEVAALREVAAAAGVSNRVTWLGQVAHEEVAMLLRSARVVACLPWYEPFGMVAVEAMACGVPVVATSVGGLAESVLDGATGILVPPRRPAAAAAAIGRLLDDEPLRLAMAAAAARRAAKGYTWSQVAAATAESYDAARLAAGRSEARVG